MKCIEKALTEKKYKPRPKWWGFVKDEYRFLCRYSHLMCIFKDGKPIYIYQETKTDKIGVKYAIEYMKKNINETD